MNHPTKFTINEFEAFELLSLIKALKAYKKGKTAECFVEALTTTGTIEKNGKVNLGTMRHLNVMEKKLEKLIEKAEEIHANS